MDGLLLRLSATASAAAIGGSEGGGPVEEKGGGEWTVEGGYDPRRSRRLRWLVGFPPARVA